MFTFQDNLRLSFGLPSPNYAGAVLAMGALSVLVVALAYRHRGRWPVLFGALVIPLLVYLLARTYSRGALVALVAGAGYLLVRAWTAPAKQGNRLGAGVGVVFLLTLAGIASGVTGFHGRLGGTYLAADRSVSNRVTLWRASLSAIQDGPLTGWGFAQSGRVYEDMYQGLEDTKRYFTPVNGFLSVGTEFGAFGLLALVLCASYLPVRQCLARHSFDQKECMRDIAAVTCVALGCCNVFSTLGLGRTLPALYLAVGAIFLVTLVQDLRSARLTPLVSTIGLAVAVCVAMLLIRFPQDSSETDGWNISAEHGYAGAISLQRRGPLLRENPASRQARRVLLLQDPEVSSSRYVREARRFLRDHTDIDTCHVVSRLDQYSRELAQSVDEVIAIGRWSEVLLAADSGVTAKISLINPTVIPDWILPGAGHAPVWLTITQIAVDGTDTRGVSPAWREFAMLHGIPFKTT